MTPVGPNHDLRHRFGLSWGRWEGAVASAVGGLRGVVGSDEIQQSVFRPEDVFLSAGALHESAMAAVAWNEEPNLGVPLRHRGLKQAGGTTGAW
jgi:hypothetical protein